MAKRKTQATLLEKRKSQMRAHPSYSIKGDGFVGHRDYFIARKFDKGHKGYLTEEEREECVKAVENGLEQRFILGLQGQAPVAGSKDSETLRVRTTQVDGQIIK